MEGFKEQKTALGCVMRNHIKNTIINSETDFISLVLSLMDIVGATQILRQLRIMPMRLLIILMRISAEVSL